MTSMFETEVYQRERHTSYARISLVAFMRDMALNAQNFAGQGLEITLTCQYRHSVASRFWWTISWVTPDGERREMSAQTLDKCLWRAVTAQINIEAKQKADDHQKEFESCPTTIDYDNDCAPD